MMKKKRVRKRTSESPTEMGSIKDETGSLEDDAKSGEDAVDNGKQPTDDDEDEKEEEEEEKGKDDVIVYSPDSGWFIQGNHWCTLIKNSTHAEIEVFYPQSCKEINE